VLLQHLHQTKEAIQFFQQSHLQVVVEQVLFQEKILVNLLVVEHQVDQAEVQLMELQVTLVTVETVMIPQLVPHKVIMVEMVYIVHHRHNQHQAEVVEQAQQVLLEQVVTQGMVVMVLKFLQ
tara:strand:+ start:138 stop:503 length:366 start_codon:yes stop_codon:yes gene_type:complete